MAPAQLAANSLSTPSTSAIEAASTLAYQPIQTPADQLSVTYDLEATIARLASIEPPAKNVALQFPDELLIDSVEIFRAIQKGLDQAGKGGRAWVLADTTYGSCCIDSLSALHIQADFLIHYGHACLTRCSDPSLVDRIHYVFPRRSLSISPCVDELLEVGSEDSELDGKGVLVMYDVGYHWALAELKQEVERRWAKGKFREVIFSSIELGGQNQGTENFKGPLLSGMKPLEQNLPVISDTSCRSNDLAAAVPPTSYQSSTAGCCSTSFPGTASSGSCCGSTSSTIPSPNTTSCCSSTTPLASSPSTCCASTNSSMPDISQPVKEEASASLRSYTLPEGKTVGDYVIFYIGQGESVPMRNLLVTHSKNYVYSYTPPSPEDLDSNSDIVPTKPVLQSYKTSKLLMRRYAVMQKARDADVFGLLVGNVNLTNSLPLLSKLRALLKKAEKKIYTISVGKLNPAKLANFSEIECFVVIACGENSLVDSKDFYQPIITPFELELAIQFDPDWTGDYVLDFTRLLGADSDPSSSTSASNGTGDADADVNEEEDEESEGGEEYDKEDPLSRPVFSTITGTYRQPKRFGNRTGQSTTSQSLTVRSQESSIVSAHAHVSNPSEHFQARTWVGLDPRVGLDKVSVLEEGRAGRAWGYEEEKEKEKRGELGA